MPEKDHHYTYLLPAGVQSLKDYSTNIFAFSATLLVVNLVLPNIPNARVDESLPRLLLQYWRHFATYIISFLSISNFWTAHYSIFENIIRSDRVLVRLNILLLLLVTFLPYPSLMMSKYGHHSIVAMVYGLTLSLTFLLLALITAYAYANNRLTRPEIHLPVRRIIMLQKVVPLALALAGTMLSYLFPRLSFVFYFVVSLTFLLPYKVYMRGVEMIIPSTPEGLEPN